MNLVLIFGALALVAVAFLAVPLLRKHRESDGPAPLDRAPFDQAVFADQLRELERDQERGVIGPEDAQAARIEIERRILSTLAKTGDDANRGDPGSSTPRTFGLGLAIFVPVIAAGFYLVLGAPQLPGQPFAERARLSTLAKGPTNEKIARMVAMVEQSLAKEPRKIEGWRILTTAYLRLGRKAEAEAALARALDLAGDDKPRAASIAVNYAEALVAMAGGQVGPNAKSAFTRALGFIPGHPAALYYLGLARLQAGDRDGALSLWRRVVAVSRADDPWVPRLKKRIEQITSGRGVETGAPPSPPAR